MIDNEIIKALECCGIETNCKDCPYHDVSCCQDELCKAALDLINRLQEDYDRLQKAYIKGQELFSEQCLENERLKVNIDKLQETIIKKEDLMQMLYSNKQAYYDELVSAKAEIERWKAECENQGVLWRNHFESIFESAKEVIKSEARKELAERLKEKAMQKFDWNEYIEVEEIDSLLKEMEKNK